MNRLRFLLPWLIAVSCLGAVLLSCGTLQPLAGGTSETTNGITATVRDTLGLPLSNATVRLRPRLYLSDTSVIIPNSGPVALIDTVTDGSGRFSVSGVDSGAYMIEVAGDDHVGALIEVHLQKNRRIDCGTVIARPTGRLYGVIDRETLPGTAMVYVQVYGMERLVRADPVTGSFIVNNMPEGRYSLQIKPSLSSFQPEVIPETVIRSGAATGLGIVAFTPYKDWVYSRRLGLNTGATGAGVAATVTDFPVLIRLTGLNFPFSGSLPDGGDMRFAKIDGTPLPYEIEEWNAVAETAAIWVTVDTLRGNDSAQSFTMYWGNPSARSESGGAEVFSVENDFSGVWHLREEVSGRGTIGVYRDATSKGFDGTDYIGATGREGIIGYGKNFSNRIIDSADGLCDKILLPASSYFVEGSSSPLTISMWFKPGQLKKDLNRLFTVMTDSISSLFIFGVYGGDSSSLCLYVKNATPSYAVAAAIPDTGWHHGAITYGSGWWQLFLDGVLVDADTMTVHGPGGANGAVIGGFLECWTSEPGFDGALDEVRFEKKARTREWIRLCYMNQQRNDKLVVFK